jgi:hypothetical protein
MNSIEFFRPFDVWIPRRFLSKKALTQRRLNKCYEFPIYSIGMRSAPIGLNIAHPSSYQFALKPMFVAFIFGAVVPVNFIVAAGLLLLVYWIDKYNGSAKGGGGVGNTWA